ncbi:MAG TPA: glycosyltransferase family 2 protein, partial [Candidatus Saccharimonadales bacterium]|nr:glycosyltransferase family 2 protein [Candidatus Saccharimonadales bacterium]
MKSINVSVVIPNWNNQESLEKCLDSLQSQSLTPHIIVVDNGSKDGSVDSVKNRYPAVELIVNPNNLGFARAVNIGITQSIFRGDAFVALINNDAVADHNWLQEMVRAIDKNQDLGIIASKMVSSDGAYLDSTGEFYSVWGLPYPRGRGETSITQYDEQLEIFGASGGASLYRVKMLTKIGLFDKDFFAYYEDVDLSFRAQLAGWKIRFCPEAVVYHQIGATSKKINGFTTYQTMKNLPWLMWKNVPGAYLLKVLPRFKIAYFSFYASAWRRHQGWPATKGVLLSVTLAPKKIWQRHQIQNTKKVSDSYIWGIMTHDLPPNAL